MPTAPQSNAPSVAKKTEEPELSAGRIDCNAQPEIPDWVGQEYPIRHIPCGMVDPSKLTIVDIFDADDPDRVNVESFVMRARMLDSMNACPLDFYSRPQNWKYLPTDPRIQRIVFPKTTFPYYSCGLKLHVGCLCRQGEKWARDYVWFGHVLYRSTRVAVEGK